MWVRVPPAPSPLIQGDCLINTKIWPILLLIVLLAACGGQEITSEDDSPRFTPRPTLTVTPRSTELPLVPTNVIPGTSEQPLKIAIIGERNASRNRLLTSLSNALTDELENFRLGYYEGLEVTFILVEDNETAYDLLCSSRDTAVFVDAFTYVAADRRCDAQPVFQVIHDGETGYDIDLVVNTQLAVNLTIASGVRRPFCVLDRQDTETMIYTGLALRAEGIDLFENFTEIISGFESDTEMLLAQQGRYEPNRIPRCVASVIPAGRIEEIREALLDPDSENPLTEAQANNLVAVDPTWQPIPYEILVFPPERVYPAYLRDEVVAGLNAIIEDDAQPYKNLLDLIGADGLQPAKESDYSSFRSWLNNTGWEMAEAVIN